MSETKWTPGPWELRRNGESAFVVGPSTNPAIPSPDIVCCPGGFLTTGDRDVINAVMEGARIDAKLGKTEGEG